MSIQFPDKLLTQLLLREELFYNPDSGTFIRLKRRGGQKPGNTAGYKGKHGYWCISVFGKEYLAHRLAWLYMTGEWPEYDIDHINQCKSDNRYSNLREATRAQNAVNAPTRKTNTSGHRGVYWFKPISQWMAAVFVKGKHIHLGYYRNKDDAIAARKSAEIEYYGTYRVS